jgi:hypothetical protein
MIRKLIAKLMGWKVVWLIDFNWNMCLRFAKPTGLGWKAQRLNFNIRPVILAPDGELKGGAYVVGWVEEYPNPGNTDPQK